MIGKEKEKEKEKELTVSERSERGARRIHQGGIRYP